MKKILVSLLVLAMCAPAMAAVTIGVVGNTDGTATITLDTGGDAVRGVALKVTCTGGAALQDLSYTANAEFNTFIDYFAANGVGGVAGDTPAQEGHPYASVDVAGEAVGDGSETEFVVSMGVLDETGAQGGYTGSGDLITINTGAGDVCVELDTVRGGIVGDAALTTNLDGGAQVCDTVGGGECVKDTASFYADWVTWGKPDCWCFQKQCRGDADGIPSGPFRVAIPDLQIFLGAYNKISALIPAGGICADFDHIASGPFRVAIPDLQILLQYYNDLDALVPVCDSSDYNFWKDAAGNDVPL